MAIVQGITNAFKTGLASGTFNFTSDTFKIALYSSTANLGPTTSAYTSSGEISGTGYVPGGATLTISVAPTLGSDPANTIAYLSFADAVWTPAAFTCRGALIYKISAGYQSVCILDFGADKTCVSSFTVQFPPATSTSAILRIA